jgi:hypothetical protein
MWLREKYSREMPLRNMAGGCECWISATCKIAEQFSKPEQIEQP